MIVFCYVKNKYEIMSNLSLFFFLDLERAINTCHVRVPPWVEPECIPHIEALNFKIRAIETIKPKSNGVSLLRQEMGVSYF